MNVINVVNLCDNTEIDVVPKYVESIKQLINNYKPIINVAECPKKAKHYP